MPLPRLYVIADYDYVADMQRWRRYLSILNVAEGVMIQIRAHGLKRSDPRAFRALAQEARELLHEQKSVLLNGLPEMASALGYDGTHLPEYRLAHAHGDLVTAATHDESAIVRANKECLSAVLFSPVFSPTSKAATAKGLDKLACACAQSVHPVFALGGIVPERISKCRAAGAYGVAVLGDVANRQDLLRHIDRYHRCLQ